MWCLEDMPRREWPIGRDGPIIDVRVWIGSEHEEVISSIGLAVLPAFSVAGLLDTGAQMTAIQRTLAEGMAVPVHDWVKLTGNRCREADLECGREWSTPQIDGREGTA